MNDFNSEFQTPPEVCRFMASLIPAECITVLEPTPGKGNLAKACSDANKEVTAPEDYFLRDKKAKYDCVVTNPPFSSKYLITTNMPPTFTDRGMNAGYRILFECMQHSAIIIALMPWFTLSDSDVRLRFLKKYGIVSITSLPRKTFEYARIQTCIIFLKKGYQGPTEFLVYDLLPKIKTDRELQQHEISFEL